MSRNNGLEQRDAKSGRFLTGNNGGGRKLGSRNLLSEDFLRDLHQEWQRSGNEALARVARDFPNVFVKVVAGLLPREAELNMSLDIDVDLFRQCRSFVEAFKLARQVISAQIDRDDEVALIEQFEAGQQ